MRGLLPISMVVIQPCILVFKLKKTNTRPLCYTGYLISIKIFKQDLLLILDFVRQQNLLNCYPHILLLLSTAKMYMKDSVRTYSGLLKIQVKC